MVETQGKTLAMPADERMCRCVGDGINYVEKGGNRMFERQGKTLAVLDDERTTSCIGAYEENLDQSAPGRFSWYFAEPSIPGLIYVATLNGYVASGPDKTKGGKENV